jgi:gamma-glutamylcysteine synthetase
MDATSIASFKQSFNFKGKNTDRGIGIECEMPLVNSDGEAISFASVQLLFSYLRTQGFELDFDEYANVFVSATIINKTSASMFDYCVDTITTDTAYSTIEIVLAPQNNLHTIQHRLDELISILVNFFDSQNCKMLGYGIQPVSLPSRKLLMPRERYVFFEKLSTNLNICESEGADSSYLNLTASNQCHVEIALDDAIKATNILNSLSGLQIAIQANSPIWEGKINEDFKANREALWDECFPNRSMQIGIPPTFKSLDDYVNYLCDFKPSIVKRGEQYIRILNKATFKDYLLDESLAIGDTLQGKKLIVQPRLSDIEQLIPFSWFNARLVPKYGTVESRMCCQQPQKETLTSTALSLGLIENLDQAQKISNLYSLDTWKKVRTNATRHALATTINGVSIIPLLSQLLDVANVGLKSRGLGEELFLQPLYERLNTLTTPADNAIAVFNNLGLKGFLHYASFKAEVVSQHKKSLVMKTS